MSDRLGLVTVAHYVGDHDNESLDFVGGNNSIMWPSKDTVDNNYVIVFDQH